MNEKKVTGLITIEDARLIYKNFQGKPSMYNAEGNRNFGVLLTDELAERLIADGWRVKYLNPKEDDPEQYRQPWLPVKIKFGMYPPIAKIINDKGQKSLDEETIGMLDWTPARTVDLVIRPYNYPEQPGRPAGVSAYMKAIYYTVLEDPIAKKYEDIPDLDGENNEEMPFD